MSAADHLVGGLVLLALVAAAAWIYPRVRAGRRAALALLFGFLGVLAGTETVYYTLAGSPSGDDFTGFLSLLGGFLLLGLGAVIALADRGASTTVCAVDTCGAAFSSRALSC